MQCLGWWIGRRLWMRRGRIVSVVHLCHRICSIYKLHPWVCEASIMRDWPHLSTTPTVFHTCIAAHARWVLHQCPTTLNRNQVETVEPILKPRIQTKLHKSSWSHQTQALNTRTIHRMLRRIMAQTVTNRYRGILMHVVQIQVQLWAAIKYYSFDRRHLSSNTLQRKWIHKVCSTKAVN